MLYTAGWGARLKLMVNHMGYSKACFAVSEFAEVHTVRVTYQDVMSTDVMPKARLDEVRAAFGLPSARDDTQAVREELAQLLLHGMRPWDPQLLLAHRSAVGGSWREIHQKRKRRRYERGAGSAQAARSAPGPGSSTPLAPP